MSFSLARLSKRFSSIRIKIAAVVFGSVLVASLVNVWHGSKATTEALVEGANKDLANSVATQAKAIESRLELAEADLRFLIQVPPVQGLLRALDNEGIDPKDGSTSELWQKRLTTIFRGCLTARPDYFQLRYILDSGEEAVRVDQVNGKLVVPAWEGRTNRSDEEYLVETMTLPPSGLYTSALTLHRDDSGARVSPSLPTIRYAVPVQKENKTRGILVIDVLGNSFLTALKTEGNTESRHTILVNQQGHYLAHPDSSKEWGFELGSDEKLANDYGEIAEEILLGKAGVVTVEGHVMAYTPVYPKPGDLSYFWIQMQSIPQDLVLADVRSFRNTSLTLLAVSLLVTVLLGAFLGQRIVARPLQKMLRIVQGTAEGDLSQHVDVRSQDEIGQVGEALNQAVEGMRTALQTDRVDWQEVGKQRQREKENMAEMAKKQAMIENAPTNIVMADKDLNITYMNPATIESLKPLAHLLPVPVDQVVGSNVDVFHKNPAHQRGILSDPNNLPHRAVIELGDQKLDLLVTPIKDDNDDYLGPMLVWENITEKMAAEEREKLQAEQIKQQAESLQNTIDQMLAEIGGLVEASREGRLSVRANADLFEGGFADLVRGVNETVDSILTPVNEAATTLEKIAGQDLTARMTGDYQGDHAALKDNLNKAVENLDQVLSQVAQTVGQVGSSSSEIANGSQSLAQGAQEQASSLEEISSSLEQMSSMTKQNADNSNQAKLLSGEAQSSAENGNASMQQMTEAIDKIKASSDQTAKIVKTIDEIAFQTNLLALNAAVEAARAGEAGKGFAVVAEEVRNLAQRSAEAAKNTADMIEESVKNAEGGVRITEEVAKVLAEIGEGSRKVNDLVAEIAAASNEQSLGIEQVNTAVSELDKVTQQNAANSEESSSAAQSLNGQAKELGDLVSTFQLNQRASEARPDVAARSLVQEVGQAAQFQPQRQQLEPVAAGSSHGGNGHGKTPEQIIPLDNEDFGDF